MAWRGLLSCIPRRNRNANPMRTNQIANGLNSRSSARAVCEARGNIVKCPRPAAAADRRGSGNDIMLASQAIAERAGSNAAAPASAG
jgi:hypothetical protein